MRGNKPFYVSVQQRQRQCSQIDFVRRSSPRGLRVAPIFGSVHVSKTDGWLPTPIAHLAAGHDLRQ